MNGETQTSGTAAYNDSEDFTSFETPTRVWGSAAVADFSDPSLQASCAINTTCGIWDWALAAGNNSVIRGHKTVPDAEDIRTHKWDAADEAACAKIDGATWNDPDRRTTFLLDAIEVMFDFQGNEDTLCESGETCLFTPNLGYYQGHGALEQAGTIGAGGTIENVTLVRHQTNGR